MMRASGIAIGAIALVFTIVSVSASTSEGAFPGVNGRIAFYSDEDGDDEIYSMNPDGSGLQQLTHDDLPDRAPAWSPDGTKIAFNRQDVFTNLWVMDADGGNQTMIAADSGWPSWSPDGMQIAFARASDIWVMDADGSNAVNLTNDPGFDANPAWSPNGQSIAFETGRDGNNEIYVMNADGGSPTNLSNNPGIDQSPNWSPDGTMIAFERSEAFNYDIWVMKADGSGQTNLTGSHGTSDHDPAWSPDGARIAFSGDEEIYVMDANGSNVASLTTPPGDKDEPDWQPEPQAIVRDLVWGDAQCDEEANPVDSLITLRHDAGLNVNLNGCPPLGQETTILQVGVTSIADSIWGNVDCAAGISPVDSLKILRYDAGLSVGQEQGCPPIGSDVEIEYFP